MGIKEYLHNLARKKEKFKDMDEDFRLQKKLLERQKNSNERELERFKEEDRQENIKAELEYYRKKRKIENEFGHQILNTPNMFVNHPSLLKQRNLFSSNSISRERSLFFS